jgi:purine-nucleoside phosphorylase
VATTVLQEREIPFTVGTTWTTDAPHRETTDRIRARRAEGCVTVEMETAAFLVVSAFRHARFVQSSTRATTSAAKTGTTGPGPRRMRAHH